MIATGRGNAISGFCNTSNARTRFWVRDKCRAGNVKNTGLGVKQNFVKRYKSYDKSPKMRFDENHVRVKTCKVRKV